MRSKIQLIFMIALLAGSSIAMAASEPGGEELLKTDAAFL